MNVTNRIPKLHDISTYLFSNDIIDEDGFINLDFKISEDLSRELDEKIENYIIENKMKLEVSFGDILFTGTFNKYYTEDNTGLSSNDIGFLFFNGRSENTLTFKISIFIR